MLEELKSRRGEADGTAYHRDLTLIYENGVKPIRRLTVHGDCVRRVRVLEIWVNRHHVVPKARSVHEVVGALGVLEESGFH